MTVNLDSPYLMPTLFGLAAVKSRWIVRESEADVAAIVVAAAVVVGSTEEVGLGVEMPMYWTPTCCRSNWGFLGLTARKMIKTTARIRRAMNEKRRKRQQQQPLKEAEEEDDVVG